MSAWHWGIVAALSSGVVLALFTAFLAHFFKAREALVASEIKKVAATKEELNGMRESVHQEFNGLRLSLESKLADVDVRTEQAKKFAELALEQVGDTREEVRAQRDEMGKLFTEILERITKPLMDGVEQGRQMGAANALNVAVVANTVENLTHTVERVAGLVDQLSKEFRDRR